MGWQHNVGQVTIPWHGKQCSRLDRLIDDQHEKMRTERFQLGNLVDILEGLTRLHLVHNVCKIDCYVIFLINFGWKLVIADNFN